MTPSEFKNHRKRLGKSQKDIAAAVGVDERTIIRLEQGHRVRPNTMQAVCAFLGIAYEPLNTVELVMPDRLKEDPDTAIMLASCANLPGIRYLVRTDPHAWAAYTKAQFRERPFGSFFGQVELVCIGIILVCAFTMIAMAVQTTATEDNLSGSGISLAICLGPIVLSVLAGAALSGLSAYDNLFSKVDLRQGYAISDDAIWKMFVEDQQVRLKRISLVDAIWRRVKRNGPFIDIGVKGGEDVSWIDRLPDHPGIVELIERTRPNDRERTLPLPHILGEAV